MQTGYQVGLVESVFWLQFIVTPPTIYIMNSSLWQLFSRILVQSEFVFNFSNSAHFRSRIPAWVFNKSLPDLEQVGASTRRSGGLAFSQSTPTSQVASTCQAHLKLSKALFPSLKMGWLDGLQGGGCIILLVPSQCQILVYPLFPA